MISIMEFSWLSGSVGILSTKLPIGRLTAGATHMNHIDVSDMIGDEESNNFIDFHMDTDTDDKMAMGVSVKEEEKTTERM